MGSRLKLIEDIATGKISPVEAKKYYGWYSWLEVNVKNRKAELGKPKVAPKRKRNFTPKNIEIVKEID